MRETPMYRGLGEIGAQFADVVGSEEFIQKIRSDNETERDISSGQN